MSDRDDPREPAEADPLDPSFDPRSEALDQALRAYRARPLPPASPDLEAALLRAFDERGARAEARPRVATLRRRAPWLAAAALLLVASRVAVRPAVEVSPQDAVHDLEVARLHVRLEDLLRDLTALEAAVVAPAAGAERPPPAAPDALFRSHAARDPGLYRLAAARSFEEIDRASAVRRYRELLASGDDDEPAFAVARDRLAALARLDR